MKINKIKSGIKRVVKKLAPGFMPGIYKTSSFDSLDHAESALFPSIWRGDFSSKQAYEAAIVAPRDALAVFDFMDDRMLYTRHPFTVKAFCASCNCVRDMHFSWHYAGSGATGSVHPAWTETGVCQICKLNSRMRAVFSYIRSRLKIDRVENVYISEQSTDFYSKLVAEMPDINVVGSEYLGADYARGEVVSSRAGLSLRNEDLTKLSFEDECFDLVISQDVFEHIPDYRKALSEIRRVLRNDGVLLFTIPFFHHMEKTQIRAIVKDGAIEHLLPAEIHGNPVSSEGSLCFQNFGWDILDDLRAAGFANVAASMYWAPWQGHMGTSFFVFSATKQLR